MLKPIFWPVIAPSLLFGTGAGSILPIAVLGALALGASQSFAAIIVGVMGAVSLVCTIPAGMLIDRLGDYRAMAAGTLAAMVVFGMIILAYVWDSPFSLGLYTLGLMLFAPIADIWNLARQAVVAEVVPPEHLSKAMTALGGSMRVGTLVGPIVGAGLMLIFPIWSVFAFAGVAAIAAIIIMSLPIARLPEAPSDRAGNRRGQGPGPQPASVSAAEDRAAGETGHVVERRPKLEVHWRSVILAGIAISTLTVARSAQPVVIQLWGVSIDLDESAISLTIAFGSALELIVMFLGGYIKDRLGRVTTLTACLTIFGLGFFLMMVLPGLTGLITGAAVMAFGNGLGAGVNMTIGADLSPAVGRARFLGIWAIFSNGGKLAGPTLLSVVITVASLRIGVLSTGLLAILGAVWTVSWGRRLGLPGRRRRRRTLPHPGL